MIESKNVTRNLKMKPNRDVDLIPFLQQGIKVGAQCFRDKFGFYPLKLLRMLQGEEIAIKGKRDGLVTWEIVSSRLPSVSDKEVADLISTTILKEDGIKSPQDLPIEDIKIAEAEEYGTPDLVESIILEKPKIPEPKTDPILVEICKECTPEKMFPEAFKNEPLVAAIIQPEVLKLAAEMNKEPTPEKITKLGDEMKSVLDIARNSKIVDDITVPFVSELGTKDPVLKDITVFETVEFGIKLKKLNDKVIEIIPISVEEEEKLPDGMFNNQRKKYRQYIEDLKKSNNL
jgi:hypothetical protein